MGIVNGFISTIKRRKTSDGYIKQSEWTAAQDVELSSGVNLEDCLGNTTGKSSHPDTNSSRVLFTTEGAYNLNEKINYKASYEEGGEWYPSEVCSITATASFNTAYTKNGTTYPAEPGVAYIDLNNLDLFSVQAQATENQEVIILSAKPNTNGIVTIVAASMAKHTLWTGDDFTVNLIVFITPAKYGTAG